MKHFIIKIRFPLLVALLFPSLFYHFELGVNVLLFDGFLLLVLLGRRPEVARFPGVRWAASCLLASAICVALVNTPGSVVAHHVSIILLVGFAQRRELRFLLYAFLLGMITLLAGPLRWIRLAFHHLTRYRGRFAVGRWLGSSLVAALVCLPFVLLYSGGSGDFQSVFEGLFRLLPSGMDARTVATGTLFLFGLNLSLTLLFPVAASRLSTAQEGFTDALQRQRTQSVPRRSPLALKRAFHTALLSLLLLNFLLLVVNFTDLVNVWVGYRPLTAPQLSQYVHEGTGNLLCSIFLAMLIVVGVFRGNLNFYSGVRPLRLAAYAWLAQNALLALSVGLRNAYYVRAYGLAHGRILVIFMIILVLVGLYSLYRKVRHRLSLPYVLQVNGLALWLFLVGYGAVNWSAAITRYNLSRPSHRIDWRYLVYDLDSTNTFLLIEHLDRMPHRYRAPIRDRKPDAPHDWRGWNYAEWRNQE